MSSKNIAAFQNSLFGENWETCLNSNDTDQAYEIFINKLNSHYQKCFPLTRCSRKKAYNKPWFTPGLKKCSRKKNQLYRKWITHKKPNDKAKYHQYKKYKKCLEQCKSLCFE